MTHKIIIVAFPIIKPLTVLMVTQTFYFLAQSCSIWQYETFNKNFKKLKYFMKYFKRKKHVFLHL